MRFRTLEELVALRLLERKPPDRARVGRWLARSRSDLALAADVLAQLDRDRAMAVAYEAGRRFRNETLYGDAPPVPEGELRQLLDDVASILDRLASGLSLGNRGSG